MEVLSDLFVLSEFVGTRIPTATANSFILPLLTNPISSTFEWDSLRFALESYFGQDDSINPAKIESGWSGLKSWIAGFKRLEAVESEEDTSDVMNWLVALKVAAIQASLLGKASDTEVLYDVLASLNDPIPSDEITLMTEQAHIATGPAWKIATTYARSFNGESPLLDLSISLPMLPELINDGLKGALDQIMENNTKESREGNGLSAVALGKRPRSESMERVTSSEGSEGNQVSHREEPMRSLASSSSTFQPIPTHPCKSPAGQLGVKALASNATKIEVLAQRLSDATGIPLARCRETVAQVPKEQLESVDTSARVTAPISIARALPREPVSYVAPVTSTSQSPGINSRPPPVARPAPVPRAASVSRPSPTPRVSPAPRNSPAPKAPIQKLPKKVKEVVVGTEEVKKQVRSHDPNRPAFAYSALIGQAILSTEDKRMRLAEIYDYVTEHYPYYTRNEAGWQNSIRHNLSLQPVFLKVPDDSTGKKGCHWKILEEEEWRFEGGGWKKIDIKGGGGSGDKSSNYGGERKSSRKSIGKGSKKFSGEGAGYSPGQTKFDKKRRIDSEEDVDVDEADLQDDYED